MASKRIANLDQLDERLGYNPPTTLTLRATREGIPMIPPQEPSNA